MKSGVFCLLCGKQLEMYEDVLLEEEVVVELATKHKDAPHRILVQTSKSNYTMFWSHGHYGSTLIDSMQVGEPIWVITFHDECLLKKKSLIYEAEIKKGEILDF